MHRTAFVGVYEPLSGRAVKRMGAAARLPLDLRPLILLIQVGVGWSEELIYDVTLSAILATSSRTASTRKRCASARSISRS